MTIILLHGEDEVKSYERLQKFIETAKGRSWEVVYLDNSVLTFAEALSSAPLFVGERFFVLADIKKLGKKESEWLRKKYKELNGNLVIYHPGIIPVSLINSLPKDIKTEEFKLPKLVFEFLEAVRPKNQKRAIELLHGLSKKDAPEFTFSLLAKHIRDLYWVKVESGSLPYPSWRVGKLKNQANFFEVDKLKELIESLAQIDVEAKTSQSEIIPSLDLLLATKLE